MSRTATLARLAAMSIAVVTTASCSAGTSTTSASSDAGHARSSAPTTAMPPDMDMGPGRGTGMGHAGDMVLPPLSSRRKAASPAQREAADDLLARIRAVVAKYEDESVARADGFVPNPNGSRLIHYRNIANRRDDRELDPDHLEGLVYARSRAGRLVLLGALFTVRPHEVAPTPAGDIFRWHTHDPSCPHFLVGPGECADTFRMLHVWTTSAMPVLDPWQQHFGAAIGRTAQETAVRV
ncbi:MAG: hypothetical protein ACXVK4_18675 [Acidimicrobiia bacterium]